MDSKLLLSANPATHSDSPATKPSKGDSTVATDLPVAPSPETAPPTAVDEPIRPFVYRAPTGKSSASEPFHPKRRSSDMEHSGN